MAIDLNINCNIKNAEVIFLTLLNYADYEELLNLISKASQIVVTALPTTGIKKHIYMVAASTTSSQNVYMEYIYTGDTSQTYDASKWEQLGEYKANVDLSGYLTKTSASTTYATKSELSTAMNNIQTIQEKEITDLFV